MTSAHLRELGAAVMLRRSGFASIAHSGLHADPVHSIGSPSLPRPPIAHNELLRCRNLLPALHRLRRDVLGLGPDSPWDD
jgi:hypothetical protein